jgi:hypothetical protein
MSNIPPQNGSKVTTRTISWLDQVERAWGTAFREPDHRIYVFSNGAAFDSTDKNLTGIYGVVGDTLLLIAGTQYPDMRDGIIIAEGGPGGSLNGGFGSFKEFSYE